VAERFRKVFLARGRACRGDGELGGDDAITKNLGSSSMMPKCSCNPRSNRREE
jgi:hypothetical protein